MKKDRKYDVAVVGGGPAGFAAALSSARTGANTVIIEKNNFLGSNMSTGMPILGFHTLTGEQTAGGIPEEFVTRLRDLGAASPFIMDARDASMVVVEPPWVKTEMLRTLQEAGVKVTLTTTGRGANYNRGRLERLKTDRGTFRADYFIDASGDGTLIDHSGLEYTIGDGNGNVQPPALPFRMSKVDTAKAKEALVERDALAYNRVEFERLNLNKENFAPWSDDYFFYCNGFTEEVSRAREKGDLPDEFAMDRVLFSPLISKGMVTVLMAKVANINTVEPGKLSEANARALQLIPGIVNFLKKYVPGFENSELTAIAPHLGIRETRRLDGAYSLTKEDVLNSSGIGDSIGRGGFFPDVHPPEGGDKDISEIVYPLDTYQIPLRILYSNRMENLLVAGRCASATQSAMGSLRVMATCMVTGEAAGAAAAQGAKHGVKVDKLDISDLQKTLNDRNVLL